MEDTRKGPFKLVTVNTAPERAKKLIGRMIEGLEDRYVIIHVDNCERESCVLIHNFIIIADRFQELRK